MQVVEGAETFSRYFRVRAAHARNRIWIHAEEYNRNGPVGLFLVTCHLCPVSDALHFQLLSWHTVLQLPRPVTLILDSVHTAIGSPSVVLADLMGRKVLHAALFFPFKNDRHHDRTQWLPMHFNPAMHQDASVNRALNTLLGVHSLKISCQSGHMEGESWENE